MTIDDHVKRASGLNALEQRLRDALRECADDLAAYVAEEYGGCLGYPSMKRRYDRDMEPVRRAREILAEADSIEQARKDGTP